MRLCILVGLSLLAMFLLERLVILALGVFKGEAP